MHRIKLISICLLLLLSLVAYPQSLIRSVISVTGSSVSENGGYLAYTTGEAVTGSLSTSVNGVTQGFQQPSLLNLILGSVGINAVEVFPNPVHTNLTILFNIRTIKILHVDLFSGRGTICAAYKFNVDESGWLDFDMRDFPFGFYILHVYSTDLQIDRTFKIEKM